MKRSPLAQRSGAALLLALWALFLLSAMVIAWALDIDSRITLSGNSSRVLEAEAMASSGAEVALDPAVEPRSSVLRGSLARNQTYEARMTGEGGRLNLNWIVQGENPQRIALLRKYLEVKGVDLNERDRMIDTLLDYVDPDDLPRLNGAESEQDYQPRNALLQRIEELKKIKGWEKFTTGPDWDADFTVFPTSGPIDLAWASRDVLLSLPGLNEPIVDRFLELRRGPDQVDGTEDDPAFESLDEVRLALGFTPDQFAQLNGLIGFNDQVMRVVSVGRSGGATRTVQMIIRKSATPQIIRWKEL
jgi:general secretion pathway protein K